MKGKITVELEYQLNEDMDHIVFRHPDLEHVLTLPYSGERMMQVQLDALNLDRPKTPIEGIVADGQELLEAAMSLKQLVPELMAAFKGKTNSGGPG
ncbi:MAG: hypothetical protein JWP44_5088 [Mucilaginibacter sp.]|nr:hypothetical protein [Mucilaginibacter sp.]